jgi:ribulose bisphosphate carboxylase small subunit
VIALTLCLKSFLKRFQIAIQTVSPPKKQLKKKQMEEILAKKKKICFKYFQSRLFHGLFWHMWPWFPLFDYINLG